MHEYQVIGRRKPTEKITQPQIFRMRIFAPNDVVAKSRFFYFLNQLHKVKRANGEILAINEIFERRPGQVKNYGVALRYQSRTGTHNIWKEFRDLTRTGAVRQLLQEMHGRHRTDYTRLQIFEVKEVKAAESRRANVQQFHNSRIRFPLPHRVLRAPSKKYRTLFKARRPGTHFG